jgi:amino acid permease
VLDENMEHKESDDGFKAEQQETNPEYNLAPGRGQNQLERGLKSRHIQFLALGMAFISLPLFLCDPLLTVHRWSYRHWALRRFWRYSQ